MLIRPNELHILHRVKAPNGLNPPAMIVSYKVSFKTIHASMTKIQHRFGRVHASTAQRIAIHLQLQAYACLYY